MNKIASTKISSIDLAIRTVKPRTESTASGRGEQTESARVVVVTTY